MLQQENAIKVIAPGKLILSGEHAVPYGAPALAMAINRYVTATVTKESLPQILFDLSDLAHHSRFTYSALHDLKGRIKRKYHRFVRGDFSIREVLRKPFELAQFALSLFTDSLHDTLPHGIKIQLQSDIPIGCGLGSSAATILSVLHAIAHFLPQPMAQDNLFKLALEAENMQHGFSSGLDLRVALQGGCLYMDGENTQKRDIPDLPFYLVNTGTPLSTTGQCVERARRHFKSSHLTNEFRAVTQGMDAALKKRSWQAMQSAIRTNHRLLVSIGVVPYTVQQFIDKIEGAEGAAKICGAGAVSGSRAGAVLAAIEDTQLLKQLCTRFGYTMMPIAGVSHGVRAA